MRLRLLTYNIHKCIGGVDRRYDPQRTADVITNLHPDVVLLQEVDHDVPRSNRDRQVDLLGDLVGMRYRSWFSNVDVRGGGCYGNAILSRYPIVETSNIDLSIRFKKKRSVLHGVIRVREHDHEAGGEPIDRTVHVFNMHLGLARFERRIQLKKFLDAHPFQGMQHETPVLVGGDLNDVYGGLGDLLRPAGFRGIERRPLTFPAWGPVRALDAVFVRGGVDFVKLSRCDSEIARRASDHRPLVAEIRLHPHHRA
ncbi:MAG: endonuclease/exonuclease/phosphatase family protein [Deltaproteobacteria bacterium]